MRYVNLHVDRRTAVCWKENSRLGAGGQGHQIVFHTTSIIEVNLNLPLGSDVQRKSKPPSPRFHQLINAWLVIQQKLHPERFKTHAISSPPPPPVILPLLSIPIPAMAIAPPRPFLPLLPLGVLMSAQPTQHGASQRTQARENHIADQRAAARAEECAGGAAILLLRWRWRAVGVVSSSASALAAATATSGS